MPYELAAFIWLIGTFIIAFQVPDRFANWWVRQTPELLQYDGLYYVKGDDERAERLEAHNRTILWRSGHSFGYVVAIVADVALIWILNLVVAS